MYADDTTHLKLNEAMIKNLNIANNTESKSVKLLEISTDNYLNCSSHEDLYTALHKKSSILKLNS